MELFRENMSREEAGLFPTLTLAHIGDCVYELLARSHVVHVGNFKVQETHRRTVRIVSAEAQHQAAIFIMDSLTEEEKAVFVRGRNAKPKTVPKHAAGEVYAYATGIEALFGWLYLLGRNERIGELWQKILTITDDGACKEPR